MQRDSLQGRASEPGRPSLIDSAPAAIAKKSTVSVLAALDGQGPSAAVRASRAATPWLARLGVVGIVTSAAVGWALIDRLPHPRAPAGSSGSEVATASGRSSALPASLSATAPAAADVAAAPPQARVEDLLPASAPAMASAARGPAASAATPVALARPKPEPKPKPKPSSQRGGSQGTEVARSATKAPAAGGSTARGPGTNAGIRGADADVDLIAAMVQHMDPHPPIEKGTVPTIAGLVARCRAKPGAEAQRCQRRICESYWGRAEACPRSAAGDPAGRP